MFLYSSLIIRGCPSRFVLDDQNIIIRESTQYRLMNMPHLAVVEKHLSTPNSGLKVAYKEFDNQPCVHVTDFLEETGASASFDRETGQLQISYHRGFIKPEVWCYVPSEIDNGVYEEEFFNFRFLENG